jgi:hypothetical protein
LRDAGCTSCACVLLVNVLPLSDLDTQDFFSLYLSSRSGVPAQSRS